MAFAKKRPYKSLFRKCTECRFHILRDDGYSNYTVEGTTFNCALGLHPAAPFDNFYAKAPELNHAEICTGYLKGDGIHLDVDGEVEDHLTPDQRHVLELEKTTKLISQG